MEAVWAVEEEAALLGGEEGAEAGEDGGEDVGSMREEWGSTCEPSYYYPYYPYGGEGVVAVDEDASAPSASSGSWPAEGSSWDTDFSGSTSQLP